MNPEAMVAADLLEEGNMPIQAYLRRHPTFLTGSRAYGTPSYYSDIDMVALVSADDMQLMKELSSRDFRDLRGATSFHFGRLNLICTSDYEVYRKWRQVTDELITRRPVTKPQAIAAFAEALGGPLIESRSSMDTSDDAWDDS